jgi:hypothetical protein
VLDVSLTITPDRARLFFLFHLFFLFLWVIIWVIRVCYLENPALKGTPMVVEEVICLRTW